SLGGGRLRDLICASAWRTDSSHFLFPEPFFHWLPVTRPVGSIASSISAAKSLSAILSGRTQCCRIVDSSKPLYDSVGLSACLTFAPSAKSKAASVAGGGAAATVAGGRAAMFAAGGGGAATLVVATFCTSFVSALAFSGSLALGFSGGLSLGTI